MAEDTNAGHVVDETATQNDDTQQSPITSALDAVNSVAFLTLERQLEATRRQCRELEHLNAQLQMESDTIPL